MLFVWGRTSAWVGGVESAVLVTRCVLAAWVAGRGTRRCSAQLPEWPNQDHSECNGRKTVRDGRMFLRIAQSPIASRKRKSPEIRGLRFSRTSPVVTSVWHGKSIRSSARRYSKAAALLGKLDFHWRVKGRQDLGGKSLLEEKIRPPGERTYRRWESNPHSRRNGILNPARLPIPPHRRTSVNRGDQLESDLLRFGRQGSGLSGNFKREENPMLILETATISTSAAAG